MYGTQTRGELLQQAAEFENDVKMYGTQTFVEGGMENVSLRMM